jgi:phosphatidylserine/phosphatidylglycerophosphate/cardiolipin synthase-like enzyme
MTLETTSLAGGAIEVTFLQQQGRDPFTATPERAAQIKDVASRLARFIGEAKSSLDIAIYDFRLHDDAATVVTDALRSQASKGVRTRIIYDNAADPGADAIPAVAPAHLEADQKPLGTDTFVHSFPDVAQIKGVTGYRVLMHNKYILRDADSADAAVFTGSSNYTNDSWGLQDNNLLCLRSQQLAAYYAQDFTELWSRGKIVDSTGYRDTGTVSVNDVPVTIAFTPGESPTVLKESSERSPLPGISFTWRPSFYPRDRSSPRCRRLSTEACRWQASMTVRKWTKSNGSGRPRMSEQTRSTRGRKWRTI